MIQVMLGHDCSRDNWGPEIFGNALAMGDQESGFRSMRAFLVNTLKSLWSVWGGRLVKIDSFGKLVNKKTVWQKIDGVSKTSTVNFHTVKSQKPLYGGLHYSMICFE